MSDDKTPRMTIRIRHLDAEGQVIGQRPEAQVMSGEPVDHFGLGSSFPPCECERCEPTS